MLSFMKKDVSHVKHKAVLQGPKPAGDAVSKSKALKRVWLPLASLDKNALNPNEMPELEFNLLVDNIKRVGVTDALLVRPGKKKGRYDIVGGHHRYDAMSLLKFEEAPCIIVDHPDFDDDAAKFQMVRHNVIRGKMSPAKFVQLYESLNKKYAHDIAAEMFGFTKEEEFKKLVAATAEGLPKEVQEQFKEAAKEVKTIEGLSKLLNSLFTQYGDSLPYGYMIFDYGGKDNVWLRMKKTGLKDFKALSEACREKSKSVDGVVAAMLTLIASGKGGALLDAALELAPEVEIPADMPADQIANLEFLEA